MLKEKILSVHCALGEILGNTKEEKDAELVRACRRNLESAAEQAEQMENGLGVVTLETEELEVRFSPLLLVSGRKIHGEGVFPRGLLKGAL